MISESAGAPVHIYRRGLHGICMLPVLLLLHFIPQSAAAQSAAEEAARQSEQIQHDQSEQERRRRLQELRELHRAPEGELPQRPRSGAVSSPGDCIRIDEIVVTGVTLVSGQEVASLVSAHEGRCFGLTELNEVLEQLSFLYVEKGFITSRALLPEQDLSDGKLGIVVVEGVLEDIVMNGQPGEYRGQIRTAFPGLQNKVLNLRDIEQGLEQINRLRSSDARIELKAGQELGGSLLEVAVERGEGWHASVSMDSRGGVSTGKLQTRVDFGFDDSFGLNDQWSLSFQRSTQTAFVLLSRGQPHSDTYTAGFSMPYGYWTISIDGMWSGYTSLLPGQVGQIETSGGSTSANLSVSRVMHRSQISKTSLSAALSWKETENFILGSRIDVSSRKLSIGKLEIVHSR